MRPGEHGKITVQKNRTNWIAVTYVRDFDGRRRRVERSSPRSYEDARRALQRHLTKRRAPMAGGVVTDKTTVGELYEVFMEAKTKSRRESKPEIGPQTAEQYRACWRRYGAGPLGALRVTELSTSLVEKHLQSIGAVSQSKRMRIILMGMCSLAARYDVLPVNPVRETQTPKMERKPVRAATPAEYGRIRTAVRHYMQREGKPGPKPGRLLFAFIALLMATGCRPNEVLALRACDVDLDSDPPTVTVSGTLIDHNRIPGKPLHRQDFRKGGASSHTVLLPEFGVETLRDLVSEADHPLAPLFANRSGGWMSLANMRRALRAALPDDLRWVTPHSFRRTVATIVSDHLGPAAAQRQLDHSKLDTTETHYIFRPSIGPDAREVLNRFAADGEGGEAAGSGE